MRSLLAAGFRHAQGHLGVADRLELLVADQHADVSVVPGSAADVGGISMRSAAPDASHRASCRQTSSWVVSAAGSSMRQRHDASPANTIDRPSPYRCVTSSGRSSPPDAAVTASTCAPGRGAPAAATDASGGNCAHRFRLSSTVTARRVAGCVAPSAVSARALAAGAAPLAVRADGGATIGQVDRQRLLERRADEPGALERSRAEHEQAAAARRDTKSAVIAS